jgi:hypothetical protein
MKKFTGAVVISAVALFGSAIVGAPAQAADPTLVLSGGSAVFGLDPASIVGTASVPGVVQFSAAGKVVKGCEAVATATTAPFVAKCSWLPAAAGKTPLDGVLTPTDTTVAKVNANTFYVTVGVPVQGVVSPINIYVDEVLATGTTGVLAPYLGGGCAVTSTYIVGQTIVWRVYANNADLGGAVMDPTNTAKAFITVDGVANPIALSYGNHSGAAFWTAILKTGAAPLYNTLGVINFKVTMIAKDTNKAKRLATKRVRSVVGGKTVYQTVSYYRDVVLKNPIAGATGVWSSHFNPASQLTLFAVPVK